MTQKVTQKMKDSVLWRNRISSSVLITLKKVNATFRLKAKGLLAGAFFRMLPAIGSTRTVYRFRLILIFLNRCQAIHHAQGMKGLVNWLKANTVVLQQSLGGFRLHDLTPLKVRVSRNLSGLPRLVPRAERALIRRGDTDVMRLYLTLLNLYRVLDFKGALKLGTITDGFKGNMERGGLYPLVISYIPAFVRMLNTHIKKHKVQPLESRGITTPAILRSAPQAALIQVSTTPAVLLLSAYGLRKTGLDGHILWFMEYFRKGTKIPYPGLAAIFESAASVIPPGTPSYDLAVTAMGKLGFKAEAAGKVRVFAMVDAWTQWVMKPFHEFIFDILKDIPMDGTFDQMKPVKVALEKGFRCAYSLDLSAATDRLPLAIQIALYSALIGSEFALRWATLLVSRGYIANNEKYGVSAILHYAVGQPMGALSSWGSLAIIHHFIVQAAAWHARVVPIGTWFTEYAVLGDDLVIFNQKVKTSYLLILDTLGVECGIAKSLLSPTGSTIEFAKRTLWHGIDISPLPLTEFVAANLTVNEAVQFGRKFKLSFPQLLSSLGYGYRVLGSLDKHIGQLNSRVRALLFAYHLPATDEELNETFFQGNPMISKENLTLVVQKFRELLMTKYYAQIERRLKSVPSTPEIIRKEGLDVAHSILSRLDKPLPIWWPSSLFPPYHMPFLGQMRTFIGPQTAIAASGAMTPVTGTESGLTSREYIATESFTRDAIFAAERVTKLLVNTPMSEFRSEASDLLWDIKGLRFQRTLFSVYSNALVTLRAISRLGKGLVPLYREVEKLPFRQDPVTMRYWKDFTSCILQVLKSTKVQEKDSKGIK